jgi:hypothetical protein
VLLALVAIAGLAIFWLNRGDGGPAGPGGRRLMPGLVTADVKTIQVRAERSGTSVPGSVTFAADPAGWTVRAADGPQRRARAEKVANLLQALREASYLSELGAAAKDQLTRHGLAEGQRVIVELRTADGRARTLELGAVVSQGGVAARVDGGWPPVEVDRQILEDVTAPPEVWFERRLAPFDSSVAQGVRVTFPSAPEKGFLASRESGQWAIREPALMRADQTLVARLLASLSALEETGAIASDTRPEPNVQVRYEVRVPGRASPAVVEIGDVREGALVAARGGDDPRWVAVSLTGLELIGQPVGEFRSRRLVESDLADIQEVEVTPGPLRLVRKRDRLAFDPPKEWGWKTLGGPRQLPLDPSAQADFLQALTQIEATDFERGPAFEPETLLVVKSGAAGAPKTEARFRFGKDEGGKRAFARLGDEQEGHVRAAATAVLSKPYWQLLARQAYSAMWFSFATIEIEEAGKRKAVIVARSTSGEEPDFDLAEPASQPRRHVPREIVNPVVDKLALLTVEQFVGHGDAAAWGLDKPKYIIKWHDSGKSQGVAPDPASGQWVTWRVADRGPDGRHAGDLDSQPGLIMKTETRDLDPFLNLLEWAGR